MTTDCSHDTPPGDTCAICAEPDPVRRRALELGRLDGPTWLAEIERVCAEKAAQAPTADDDPPLPVEPPLDLDRYRDRFGGR